MAVSETNQQVKSLIPPRTLAKIDRLGSTDRKVYLQEMIGNYEARILEIDKVGQEMMREWCEKQVYYLWQVHGQLVELMKEETSGVQY